MSRKGARPGDVVAVTGTLGKAGAGYLALHHHMKNRRIIAGLLEPVPRIAEGKRLAQEKIVTSCMDLSDGLSSSLYQLMEMNHVGFTIQRDCIPVSPLLSHVTKQNRELWNSVLHFGGDYELLLTLPTDLVHRAVHCLQKIGTPLTMIGKVTKSQDIVLVSGTQHKILPDKGYEHFQKHIF